MDNIINNSVNGLIITPLRRVATPGGDVLHAIKASDSGFIGFGEAYFSKIKSGSIKGWKRHTKMTMNLIVPIGEVRFIIYDDRDKSNNVGIFQQIILDSKDNYNRLTIPPMVWLGFQGINETSSIILNIASIEHSIQEIDKKELSEINFNWNK